MSGRYTRAALLLGFALLIAKLFVAQEMVKYMSPALDPLTALTGLVLGLMGLMELRAAHRRLDENLEHHPSTSSDQALTILLLAVPLALGLLVTPRGLGASALGGENIANLLLTFAAPATGARWSPSRPIPGAPIEDIPDLLAYLGQAGESGVGQPLRVTGLVAGSAALGPDEFALLRFSIAHCVADARPLGLLVVAPEYTARPADQWVAVEGTLDTRERNGDRLVTIVASTITPIEEPRNPYVSLSGR